MEVRSLALRRNVDFHAVDGDRMHPLCICEQSPKIDFEREGFHDENRWRVVAPAMPQRQSRALNTYRSVMASPQSLVSKKKVAASGPVAKTIPLRFQNASADIEYPVDEYRA